MLGTLAILGTPPFGVFASEFLILTTAMKQQPWATPIMLLALGVAFAAIFGRVQPMVFGDTSREALAASAGPGAGVRASRIGVDTGILHSALSRRLVSRRGAIDRRRVRWRCKSGSMGGAANPARGAAVDPGAWCRLAVSRGNGVGSEDIARGRGRLLSLWAGRDATGREEILRAAFIAGRACSS